MATEPVPAYDITVNARAVNKVVVGSETLIDLSGDTVTPETMMQGVTAHNAAGNKITGTAAVTVSGTTLILPPGLVSVS